MSNKNTKVIEEGAVSVLKSFLRSIVNCDRIKEKIDYEVLENDKTPITDGFIRVDNKDIVIQLKGSVNVTKKMSIDVKYYNYASEQLLLFIYITGLKDESSAKIYYEFFTIEFLEKKLKGKYKQSKIQHNFTKELNGDTIVEFLTEFKQYHFDNPLKKMKTPREVFLNPNKYKVDFSVKLFKDSFASSNKIEKIVATNIDTGLKYGFSKENIMYLYTNEEENQIVIDDVIIPIKKEVLLNGNIKIKTRNFEILVDQEYNCTIQPTHIDYLNDHTLEELKLLEVLSESGFDKFEEFTNSIEVYEKNLELKNKVFSKINNSIRVKISEVEDLYNLLYNKVIREKTPYLQPYRLEDGVLFFKFNSENKMYELITNKDNVGIRVGTEEEKDLEPQLVIPLVCSMLLQDYSQQNLTLNINTKILNFDISESFIYFFKKIDKYTIEPSWFYLTLHNMYLLISSEETQKIMYELKDIMLKKEDKNILLNYYKLYLKVNKKLDEKDKEKLYRLSDLNEEELELRTKICNI